MLLGCLPKAERTPVRKDIGRPLRRFRRVIMHYSAGNILFAEYDSTVVVREHVPAGHPLFYSDLLNECNERTQALEQVEAMMNPVVPDTADVIVIGGGPGGYVAAIRAAQLGGNVILVEKENLGGVCLNRGCVPTKAMLSAADVYDTVIRRSGDFGVKIDGAVSFDYGKLIQRRDKIVKGLVSGVGTLMKANKIKVLKGSAQLASRTTVEVVANDGSKQTVSARNIIIATGSEPVKIPIPGLEGDNVWDSDGALAATHAPKSILIIGGGAIGLEWGYMFRRFGAEVTVVELMSQVLPLNDSEIAKELEKALRKTGIKILTEHKVVKVEHKNGREVATIEPAQGGPTQELIAEKILVAVGRRPVIGGLRLEVPAVATDRGRIVVDEHMRTNIPNIYAIGDVIGGMLLAHKASEEGVIAAENCMGKNTKMSYKAIPACVYTTPEVATVGMTEDVAKERGIHYKTGKFYFRANGKALGMGETDGLVKFVVDGKYGEVLGCHLVGPHVTDMIHEVIIAMESEATIDSIARAVHAHPTLSEVTKEAALDADGESIHKA
jgi:dihydrolipoamide dehydrogenase